MTTYRGGWSTIAMEESPPYTRKDRSWAIMVQISDTGLYCYSTHDGFHFQLPGNWDAAT